MKVLFLPILLFGSIFLNQHIVQGETNLISEKQITQHFIKYATKTQNIEEIEQFEKIKEIFSFPHYILRKPLSDFTTGRQTLMCLSCRAVITTLKTLYGEGYTEAEILDIITDFCVILGVQTEDVCRGAIRLNLPIILYLLDNLPNFKDESFCGITFQSNNKDTCPFEDENYDFVIDLPPKVTKKTTTPKDESNFKIIHISEIHYEPVYEPYGLAECNEPTCCRIGQTETTTRNWESLYDDESSIERISRDSTGLFYIDLDYAEEVKALKKLSLNKSVGKEIPEHKRAGYWGDYRHCDAPWWAIEDFIDKIVENHNDYDIIYYTGDTIDHGVWETTRELITESTIKSMNKLKSAFPNKRVFPAIGNHESQPVNQFAPEIVTDPELTSAWMYEMLTKEWDIWLPAATAQTIKRGGYYTAFVRPGFRVIVINSNICETYNWWIHMQPKDPSGQLQWLADTLASAEMQNEKVHILSHIPPGNGGCVAVYTREYKRIVERFADTIAGEFNGHTHKDEFKIFYAKNDINKPLSLAWNGGSITANADVNPNYRLYEVNGSTYDVLDIETWIYNLTEANLTPNERPRWFKEYTFKEKYGATSLTPEGMDELLQRMVTTNQHLFDDYSTFQRKTYSINKCNESCVRKILATITQTELYDDKKFQQLWEIFQANKP